MYVPGKFIQDDRDAMFALIEANPFGTLAIATGGRVEFAHAPILFDRTEGPNGRLRLHLARANPWWKAIDGSVEAVAAFIGSNAYVSPDWYGTENQVPTWNYNVVHATGVPEIMDDESLIALLDDLSASHEDRLRPKTPWTSDKLPEQMYRAMRKAIVGLTIPIATLEGKWKLGQNRKPHERMAATETMAASDDAASHDIGRQMAEIED